MIMIQTNSINLEAKPSFWAGANVDGGEDTIELKLTEKIHKRYECGKTDDEARAQLPVDSLKINKRKLSKIHLETILRSGLFSQETKVATKPGNLLSTIPEEG